MPEAIPDKTRLLERLPKVNYSRKSDQESDAADQMSLVACMLGLAQLTPEREFLLCNRLAEHLLGEVPGPPEMDFEDEPNQ